MDLKPSAVILYEPHLDFMRSLEVYGAADPESTTRVHLLMNEESVEFYQYMSLVDDEKLGFSKLIEAKEVSLFRNRLHLETLCRAEEL
jgi:DNA excision repair protein ERCC-4